MASLKDLIVTGPARFLNKIYGNLVGNATSADKVNHTLTIFDGADNEKTFNGLSNVSITAQDILDNIGMNSAVRIVGSVNTTSFNGASTLIDKTKHVLNLGSSKIPTLFLSEIYGSDIEHLTGPVTYGGTTESNIITYYPQVGDIVIQGDQEFLCIQKVIGNSSQSGYSLWVSFDSSGVWGTW